MKTKERKHQKYLTTYSLCYKSVNNKSFYKPREYKLYKKATFINITENNSTLKNKKGCYMGDSYSVPEVYQNYLRMLKKIN